MSSPDAGASSPSLRNLRVTGNEAVDGSSTLSKAKGGGLYLEGSASVVMQL